MADRKKTDESQLSLSLAARSKDQAAGSAIPRKPILISFVDSTTLKIRREAASRVKSAGIFSLPSKSKR